MKLVIGLDTGGTYTDAALLDAAGGALATAKSLTTRDDLSIGTGGAIAKILQAFDGPVSDIGMCRCQQPGNKCGCRGVGGRVGLFMIGFDDKVLERADLARAIGKTWRLSLADIVLMAASRLHLTASPTKAAAKWRLMFRHLLLLHILQRAIQP